MEKRQRSPKSQGLSRRKTQRRRRITERLRGVAEAQHHLVEQAEAAARHQLAEEQRQMAEEVRRAAEQARRAAEEARGAAEEIRRQGGPVEAFALDALLNVLGRKGLIEKAEVAAEIERLREQAPERGRQRR